MAEETAVVQTTVGTDQTEATQTAAEREEAAANAARIEKVLKAVIDSKLAQVTVKAEEAPYGLVVLRSGRSYELTKKSVAAGVATTLGVAALGFLMGRVTADGAPAVGGQNG